MCVCRIQFKGDKIHFIKSLNRYRNGLITDQTIYAQQHELSKTAILSHEVFNLFNKITIKIVSLLIGFNNYTARQAGRLSS